MVRRKIKLIKNIDIKINLFILVIFIILSLVVIFFMTNLIAIIELRKQVSSILGNSSVTYNLKPSVATSTLPVTANVDTSIVESAPQVPVSYDSLVASSTNNPYNTATNNATTQTYSNVTAEPFFGSYLVDSAKTTMRLDELVTAMTFKPVYSFKKDKNCTDSFCGLLASRDASLSEANGQIFYKNIKINLPSELQDKKIVNFTFSLLSTKWIVGIVTNENNQEVGYAYLFDGQNLKPLITSDTLHQIKTQYQYTGGSVSAGGSDSQFIILYSGYEGIGYLYNNGSWQDLSSYFGLRVTRGGFKAKIIRGGAGNSANWYVCSDTTDKPKLIKLWQNNTSNIQGSIDLSTILDGGTAICASKGSRELSITRNITGENSLYTFIDKGFDNSHTYKYQSVNLSDYTDKKITSVQLRSYTINAPTNLYTLSISTDLVNWQSNSNCDFNFKNLPLATFYVKVDFKNREADYSPWFGGLELISYTAQDMKK